MCIRDSTNRTAEVFNFALNDNLGLISTDGKKSDRVFTLEPFDEVYVLSLIHIFQAVMNLYEQGVQPDMVSVDVEMRRLDEERCV